LSPQARKPSVMWSEVGRIRQQVRYGSKVVWAATVTACKGRKKAEHPQNQGVLIVISTNHNWLNFA